MLLQQLLLVVVIGGDVRRRAGRRSEVVVQCGGVEERVCARWHAAGSVVQIGRSIGRAGPRLGPLAVVALSRPVRQHVTQAARTVLVVRGAHSRVLGICKRKEIGI